MNPSKSIKDIVATTTELYVLQDLAKSMAKRMTQTIEETQGKVAELKEKVGVLASEMGVDAAVLSSIIPRRSEMGTLGYSRKSIKAERMSSTGRLSLLDEVRVSELKGLKPVKEKKSRPRKKESPSPDSVKKYPKEPKSVKKLRLSLHRTMSTVWQRENEMKDTQRQVFVGRLENVELQVAKFRHRTAIIELENAKNWLKNEVAAVEGVVSDAGLAKAREEMNQADAILEKYNSRPAMKVAQEQRKARLKAAQSMYAEAKRKLDYETERIKALDSAVKAGMARADMLEKAQAARKEKLIHLEDCKLMLDKELEHYRATGTQDNLKEAREKYDEAKRLLSRRVQGVADLQDSLASGTAENLKTFSSDLSLAKKKLADAQDAFERANEELADELKRDRDCQLRKQREKNRAMFNRYCEAVEPSKFTKKVKGAFMTAYGDTRWDAYCQSFKAPRRSSMVEISPDGEIIKPKPSYGYRRPSVERAKEVAEYVRHSAIIALRRSRGSSGADGGDRTRGNSRGRKTRATKNSRKTGARSTTKTGIAA